jgi:steroid delta-isomerase-like uncharacterized protein
MAGDDPTVMIGTKNPESQMTREDVVAFFGRRQAAYDNLDAAALAAGYADDCIVESRMAGSHTSRAAVERVFRAVFDAFPDHKLHAERLVIDGNSVAQILTLEGTDIGGFLGLPPSGKTFRVPAVFVYEFKNGKIWRERRIYDFTGVLMQIGVLKAKPV